MGVLSRLRDFTADRDAIPPVAISAEGMDNEFDQLLAESNAQNTRLGANETRLTALEAPGSVGTADLADDSITPAKTSFVDDALVATDTHIMVGDGTDFGNVAVSGDATLANTGALTISNDAVTTAKVLDANVTLAKLQNATATNKILGRVSTGTGVYEEVDLQTTLSSTDEAVPTSKAVRDDIVSLVNDVGGFVAVADDQSFPNTNPDPDDGAGTVVSVANAGGLVVDGSGVTTTGQTLGGSTVTINGIPSDFYSSTIGDGLGMQVITTSTLNTYTFHRLTAKEVDISTVATNITNVNNVGGNITNVGLIAGQISPTNNISTLSGINSDITTVSGISSDVQTVSAANANISTCADNITGINSFGDRYRVGSSDPTTSLDTGDLFFNSSTNELKAYGASSWQNTAPSATDQNNINIVAGDVTHSEDLGSIADALTTGSGNGDITTCATNIGNIGSVAGNSANINLVGNSISNVNATGGAISAINTISTNISSVNSVSTNIASVNTCATDMSKIVETANDLQEAVSEIDTVATNIANINAVGNDIANVNAVASDSTDIGAVAGKATEIGLLGNATTVSNLGQVGTTQAVSDLGTCATNISNIGTVAGVATGINFFTDRYRIGTTDPTTDNDAGDLFFNTSTGELRAYSTSWQATAPSADNQQHINNVSGALVYEDDLGSITDALNTSSSTGDIATVSNNIDEIGRLGTAQAVSDIQTLGTATNVGHLQTVSGSISHVQAVSSGIADINRYAQEYTIASTTPGSPSAGDLWYDSSANVLKYYTGSAFASLTAGIAELVQDTSPELGAALDCLNNNISNCGTIDGSNLQIDFGGLT